MRGRRLITALWWGAGALTLVGIAITLVAIGTYVRSASFGWFAYQPLADEVFMPSPGIMLTPTMALGAAGAVLGLIVLSFLLGRHLATRAGSAR